MPSGYKLQLSNKEIKQIIHEYTKEKMSARAIAKKHNIKCHKSIIKLLENQNIYTRDHKQSTKLFEVEFTPKQKKYILEQYEKPKTNLTDLSKELGHSPKTIQKFLKKQGVYDRFKFDKYLINKFDIIDTEEQAYWLGFLAADGSVSKKQLTLLLAEKDLQHLLKFKNFIGADYSIRKIITKLNNKEFIGYAYSISSTKFVASIKKHNVYPKKSFTVKIPNTIPDPLLNHYIRGVFDGDGSVWVNKNNQINISIISSCEMCNQIQNILHEKCLTNMTKQELFTSKNTNLHYAAIKYCGNHQTKRIFEFLYKDATIFLERKKDVFREKVT